MKLYNINSSFALVIPNHLIKKKKWMKGDNIIVDMNETGDLILKKVGDGKTTF